MIQSWAEEIRGAMADKNVYAGLTVFANDAKTVYEMSQLTAESTFDYSLGEEMLWLAGHTGTNLQAGIRAGLADLEKAPRHDPPGQPLSGAHHRRRQLLVAGRRREPGQ